VRTWLIALGAVVVILVGFLFVGGSAPVIVVAPETVGHIGPLAVTNTMLTGWCVVVVVAAIGIIAGRGLKLVPTGFAGAVEAAVVAFYDICVQVAGEKNGRRFFPVCATIFFFILVSNYMGLLPFFNVVGKTEPAHGTNQPVMSQSSIAGLDYAYIPLTPDTVDTRTGATPLAPSEPGGKFSGVIAPFFRSTMTDVNAPLAIALWSAIFVEFWALSTLGPMYLTKFFNFSRIVRLKPIGIIDVFVGILEFVSELARIVSFTFRLFGNIFAGDVVLLMGTFLVPFLLVDIFYGLEMFVGLIQSFIFAMLTLVFAHSAVTFSHGDHAEEHGAAH
jgi:F-type H+-transporting ATPase subunit a